MHAVWVDLERCQAWNVGGEGECARGRREDCALRVIVHGRCRERARVYSSIVACAVEREEVRECMELLKKSFGIDQQCGCVNANAKRKANVKKKKEDNEEAA